MQRNTIDVPAHLQLHEGVSNRVRARKRAVRGMANPRRSRNRRYEVGWQAITAPGLARLSFHRLIGGSDDPGLSPMPGVQPR